MSRWNDPSTVWDEFFWDAPDDPGLPAKKRKKINRHTMSNNPTPDNNDILRALADRLADGCHTHEATIGILHNTEAVIRAGIALLDQKVFLAGQKKAAVDTAYTANTAADAAGEIVLVNCKLRLQQKLGQRWNAQWAPTGFPHQSTAVPDVMDERFTLLKKLNTYFIGVPAHESADMGATAAICLTAWDALSTTRQGIADAESAQTTALTNQTDAADGLRKRVRGLINELDELIEDDDARWEAFGLNIPANPSAPESVASVTAAPLGNGRFTATWPYATRAIRYRAETFIVGVDTEWKNKGSFKDLEAILKGFTAGQTVKVRIVAGNDGGDAAPSPEAQVVVT
jgi:transposase